MSVSDTCKLLISSPAEERRLSFLSEDTNSLATSYRENRHHHHHHDNHGYTCRYSSTSAGSGCTVLSLFNTDSDVDFSRPATVRDIDLDLSGSRLSSCSSSNSTCIIVINRQSTLAQNPTRFFGRLE